MEFPKDIPAFQVAFLALSPEDLPTMSEEVSALILPKLAAAQLERSAVPQCGAVLDMFNSMAPVLDAKATRVLLGATYLIGQHGFMQRGEEAYPVHQAALARLAELEAA